MRKNTKIREYELPIDIREETDGSFTALCPKWVDCYAQGDSIDEVINEISAVAATLIELYQEEELSIPLTLRHTKNIFRKQAVVNMPLFVSA